MTADMIPKYNLACKAARRPLLRRNIRSRGKSELHRVGCLLTAGRGDPTESATEIYRLELFEIRVKW